MGFTAVTERACEKAFHGCSVRGAHERRELSEEIQDQSSKVKSPCRVSCSTTRHCEMVAGCLGRFPQLADPKRMTWITFHRTRSNGDEPAGFTNAVSRSTPSTPRAGATDSDSRGNSRGRADTSRPAPAPAPPLAIWAAPCSNENVRPSLSTAARIIRSASSRTNGPVTSTASASRLSRTPSDKAPRSRRAD